ncbi:cell wall hydrolase [Hansschlegelia sp. KR7-227]|uniref:cell wall hydrolase n=1 Tax=Hansschlegelia sp. KR7-227 TaxID=3400914 RepID=UPI003BFC7B47
MTGQRFIRAGAASALALLAAGCAQKQAATLGPVAKVSYTSADRDCMARAMYFESHRSADEGMLAVGTVVANRLKSGRYGASVCDVVGQKGQFAPGVMTRSMDDAGAERARKTAEAVLSGKRHPGVRDAMFFHTAGLRFRYPNMHYVLVAGGNAFYEKRETDDNPAMARDNAKSRALALAYARVDPTGAAKPIVLASAEPLPPLLPRDAAPSRIAQPVAAPVVTASIATARPETSTASVVSAASAVPVPQPRTAEPAARSELAAVEPQAQKPGALQRLAADMADRPAASDKPKRTISVDAKPVLASAAPIARDPEPQAAPARGSLLSPTARAWSSFSSDSAGFALNETR